MDQPQPQQMLPIWAIVLIVILAISLISITVFCIKKRKSRSLSVDTMHQKEDEKKSMSTASFQTLVTQQPKLFNPKSETFSSSFSPSLSLSPPVQPLIASAKKTTTTTTITPQLNEKTDKTASIDESEYSPPEPPQEIKISLPLPPPSTSFFSDKMELDNDDAQDFYDMYLTSKKTQDNNFMSIDLDMPSFYSNVQQKAATIKSTLRQSLRVKQKSNRNSIQQLFTDEHQTGKSGEDSAAIMPIKEDSSKVIIDMNLTTLKTIQSPQTHQKSEINIVTQSSTSTSIKSESDTSPITPDPNLQEPVRAAKRVIRSASKKTKTRSMRVTDPIIDLVDENNENSNGKKSKHGSIRYASIRGSKNNGEHTTITSGSMRRLVRESILFDDDALPLPSSAITSSSATPLSSIGPSAKKSVVDIAGWWDTPKTITKPVVADSTENFNENPLVLNITSGLDSTSSNIPNQYRASLSTSIFAGTLSKASGSSNSLLPSVKDEAVNNSNDGVSRHSSFRRGTLGRNTLRSITATATNGVNRSLKGLFDYPSSNSLSNKVVPDDSQKMELDSEPSISTCESADEKVVADQPYNSNRQKSVRASISSNNRPCLPTSYSKTPESSTKYALTDDEEIDENDESSKKTALNNTAQHELPTLPKEHPVLPTGSSKTEATILPISKLAKNNFAEDNTPNSPINSITHKSEVDTIRRMLQDTWVTNIKESSSNYSIISEADSTATTSTQSTVSSRINSRHQQPFLSKSLLTQQVAKRASLLARHNGEEEFIPQQGPEPSASFSSSTVRTMVPATELATTSGSTNSEQVAIRQNAISKMHGSNKIQESSFDDKSNLMNRFSTSTMTDTSAVSSPRNSSAHSSRGHSRKSSGGNSAATALRISSGYSTNAKTWNGRAQKKTSKPSVTQQEFVSPDDSLGRSSINKKFFSTMRKGQKIRGNIPWMMEEEATEKTPAQIERDRYLKGGSNL
ncbi:hypothetical protein INT46_005857 [Mucor plumbeus]|uniref:Uncharacterized protein n=1 Tax=Mucor plumbeus TaxID=97098 RepID=A0A8H7RDC8_9FUNG|nr:hypothetical protein INT46_005857 [Mucor plumbeus]